MTQEQIMELIAQYPEGIMQCELCKKVGMPNGGTFSQQVAKLRYKKMIRRENVRGKWRLYATNV